MSILPMISKICAVLLSILMLPLTGFTYSIEGITGFNRDGDIIANISGIGAYTRSQGITTDGEYYYFSSKNTLIKTELDGRTIIKVNINAISNELKNEYGIKHIGGISYYDGKIYAGMEDSKVWKNPTVGIYDAETLDLIGYHVFSDLTVDENLLISRGMPWVAVDKENGLLYCMDHSKKPKYLLSFDLTDFNIASKLEISECVESIQGGEIQNGILYAASNNSTQAIFSVELMSGYVNKLVDRNLTLGEGEGLTILNINGVPTIVAIDMGTLFVNTFLRKYSIVSEDI